ncbi:Protein phosphatase 2C family protein [Perilla frutescens var. hirtella]|nr:Protein phosphatase 2C family protein [Perilla frutescens var. hirtella]
MPIGLLSNLNLAFGFAFPRAARVKQYQPLHLIEALFLQKCSNSSLSSSSGEVIRDSCNRGYTKIMAASGSIVASDLVVDTLVSSCGSLCGFVKPGGVYFGNKRDKVYQRASLRLRSVANGGHRGGGQGWLLFDLVQSSARTFSSSCYSDRAVPEVSADGSLSAQQLPSLAVSDEQNPSHSTFKLLSGACYLPHPAKVETGGEDAHFICADEQVIGVADGVGGWADVGVNAGVYARELMSNSVEAIRKGANDVDPFTVLEKAHAATKAMGSSTACIIALKNQDLHAINLGDSGFMIVRDGAILFESPVQQHGFNFTYQLERGDQGDLPSSGQVFKISVVPGDVVVAGSDGLFDNLYAKEIAAIVVDAVKEGLGPDDTAQKIAAFARVRALDKKRQTPFSTAANEAGWSYNCGKLDDLTVVVSYVSS